MKLLITVILLLILRIAPLPAATPVSADDLTVIPGVRVGAIEKGATLENLQTAYGKENVIDGELPGPEGSVSPGAWIFKGTDKELQVMWEPETGEKMVTTVIIIGKAWKFDNGLKLGASIEEVGQANGAPFKLSGFDWDYGGWANFEGGKLNGVAGVRFYPSVEQYDPELSGERDLLSTDAKLLGAKPVVTELIVVFQ